RADTAGVRPGSSGRERGAARGATLFGAATPGCAARRSFVPRQLPDWKMLFISLAAEDVASSTVALPVRIFCTIDGMVLLPCTFSYNGVTGTLAPPSTICLANGETSGSSCAMT